MRHFSLSMIIILGVSIIELNAQPNDYEQRAFNYFIDSIFLKEYIGVKVIEFSGLTEDKMTNFGAIQNCFTEDTELVLKLAENAHGKLIERKIVNTTKQNNILFRKLQMKSEKRLKLFILQSNEVNNKVYVMLEVNKHHSYTNTYIFI